MFQLCLDLCEFCRQIVIVDLLTQLVNSDQPKIPVFVSQTRINTFSPTRNTVHRLIDVKLQIATSARKEPH